MDDECLRFLDLAYLHTMKSLAGAEAYLVIDRFAADLPDRLKRMASLMGQPGNAGLNAEIHRMKGSAATCGFHMLADLLAHYPLDGTADFQQLEACVRNSLNEWRAFRNTSHE